jgi:NtrC-family two-component system sensor histidine kinase KinB
MRFRSLQTRFLLAGSLLVLATVAGGAWSVLTLTRLSAAVGETLRESQANIDLATGLAGTLEREDDALVLALSGRIRNARSEVGQHRQDFDAAFARLLGRASDPEVRAVAGSLKEHVDAYRAAGDKILAEPERPGARDIYHQQANPALRRAVDDCGKIRELNAQAMQQVGVLAANETRRATVIVAGIALMAFGLSTLVMVRLAQVVVGPIRDLSRSVEAIRRNAFASRVPVTSEDELGQLADGFNRMAERLGEYHESSLGELLAAKTTLEATLAALPDAVVVVDPDGRIASKNRLAEDVLKATGGSVAQTFGELPLPPAVLRDVGETLHGGRTGGTKAGLDQALAVTFDGRPWKLLVSVVPIPEFFPHRAGAAIVLADVTEFARLDELRSEVVAVASHELKTPLTSLQVNLLLLKEKADNLTPRQHEILSAAVRGAEDLAATIEELLDLARIEAGQLHLDRQRVDIAGVVEQAVQKLRPLFDDAGVAVRVVRDTANSVVAGDAARLRLVVTNLLTNALKYSPQRKGEVVVRLWADPNTGGKPQLHVAVTDSGPGVPADLRERVFDKFFRVEDEHPDGFKGVRGTGIGLYLSREIVKAHGGTIACEPGDGGMGTRIALSLPLDR